MKKCWIPIVLAAPLIPVAAHAQEAPTNKKVFPPITAKKTVELPSKGNVKFKAFLPTEFNHIGPNGGKKPIKPGEMLKLKNGKTVKFEDYVASTNELEKRLNGLGYSLRTPITLPPPKGQEEGLKSAQAKLDAQAAKTDKGGPTVMLDGIPYDKAMAAIEASTYDADSGSMIGNVKNEPVDSDSAEIAESLLAKGTHQMKVSGGKNGDWSAEQDGFGFYFKCSLNMNGTTEVGNTNGAGNTVKGNQYSQSLSQFNATASADAGITLFSQDVDILHADANYSGSDQSGNVQISAHLTVLGNQIWQDSMTAPIGYSDGHTWSQAIDSSVPSVTIPCSICSIGVQAGFQGSAGITVGYKLFTSRIEGNIHPFVHLGAYFRAGAGIDLGIASAEIGVQGNLNLLDEDQRITANAGIHNENGFRFKDNLGINNSLNALSGNVSVYASASFLFFSDSVTIPIFSWNGLSSNSTLYDYSQDIKLPWH